MSRLQINNHHGIGFLLFFCIVFLLSSNPAMAQSFFKEERIGYELTIEGHEKTINSYDIQIRSIKNQMMILRNEIKKHKTVIEDFKKVEEKYQSLKSYYDSTSPIFKDWHVFEKLADDPLYLSGDFVIRDWRGLKIYRDMIIPKAQSSREALELLEEDLRLMTNELQDKEALISGLEEGTTQMKSELAIEGYWQFLKPKNDSTIHITFNKDENVFVGKWYYLDDIKYFKKGDVVLLLDPPSPDSPNVYRGTEFGFDDAGRKIRFSLSISIMDKTMTYRTKERTYSLRSIVRPQKR